MSPHEPVPRPKAINPGIHYGCCEECHAMVRIYRVEDAEGSEWWLCADCRADRRETKRLGAP